MNYKLLRIASLNARSVFKEADIPLQKFFTRYLHSRSLHIDILCLQEVFTFRSQDHLTDD